MEYLVDPLDRRIGRKVNGVIRERFLYADQLSPIAEWDSTGAIVSRFVYATQGHSPDYLLKPGAGGEWQAPDTFRVVKDHLGSPRFVVEATTGTVCHTLDYDAWGNVVDDQRTTAPGDATPCARYARHPLPFRFAGGLWDEDTGLVRFGARDYDPRVGRWTAKDPLLFGAGDANLYAYALLDPVNLIDPSGEIVPLILGAIAAVEGLAAVAAGAAVVATGITACATYQWATADRLSPESTAVQTVIQDAVRSHAYASAGDAGSDGAECPAGDAGAPKAGRTVLGKYPDYIHLADDLAARRFNVPGDVWARMTKAEQWVANKKFLDRMILRGDDIILSNPVKSINDVTGAFRRELDYLIEQGFRLSPDGTRMIR